MKDKLFHRFSTESIQNVSLYELVSLVYKPLHNNQISDIEEKFLFGTVLFIEDEIKSYQEFKKIYERASEKCSVLNSSLYFLVPSSKAIFFRENDLLTEKGTIDEKGFINILNASLDYEYLLLFELKLGQSYNSLIDRINVALGKIITFGNYSDNPSLVSKIEYWERVTAYSCFSAYPIFGSFYDLIFRYNKIADSRKILIAPCGTGDMIRFFPGNSCNDLSIYGLDIQQKLTDFASTRLRFPEIDELNFYLLKLFYNLFENPNDYISQNNVKEVISRFCTGDKLKGNLLQEHWYIILPRLVDQLVRNRAIPDWFSPLKILSFLCGHEDFSTESLLFWIKENENIFDGIILPNSINLGSNILRCNFVNDDILKFDTDIDGFDLVINWEFSHLVKKESDSIVLYSKLFSLLRTGGSLIITGIRISEKEQIYYPLQSCLKKILLKRDAKVNFIMFNLFEKETPFNHRLRGLYPITIIQKL